MRLPFSFALNRHAAGGERASSSLAFDAGRGEEPPAGLSQADEERAFKPGLSEAPPPGTIGAILVASGRITVADVQRIVVAQLESNSPFGEAAIRLGLVNSDDVQSALSKQFAMPCVPAESDAVDPEVIAAFRPEHELAERMRMIRGHIARHALERASPLRSVALLSSERGAGRTYIAANLAAVFAQLGARTLLIDANLQRPRLHTLFRTGNRSGVSSVLAGRSTPAKSILPIPDLSGLEVLPAGPTPPNPDDLIARPTLAQLLRRFEEEFEIIIIDTPAWTEGSCARLVAAAARAAIQLVQPGQTAAADANELAQQLDQSGCELIGAVLNRH